MKKIDMHVHTRYSFDNDSNPLEIIETAIARGLDGIAFTDHNVYLPTAYLNYLRKRYDGFIILRGIEITTIKDSHVLVYGVPHLINNWELAKLSYIVNEAKAIGGVAVPAHPYRWGFGDRIFAEAPNTEVIEGRNGGNTPNENKLAIELARNNKKYIIGGSDSHEPDTVGLAYTCFYEDNITDSTIGSIIVSGNYTTKYSNKYEEKWARVGVRSFNNVVNISEYKGDNNVNIFRL